MSTEQNKYYKSIDEILTSFRKNTNNFVESLKKEDELESVESKDNIFNKIKADINRTENYKLKFINEINNGLGNVIKQKSNDIKIIKKPWYLKLLDKIKNIL